MKALGVLGTGSGAGKSWITTALCAWLHRQGVRVAPFKAQNMSNNAQASADGREVARAQAVQAEACGLRPDPWMNPILIKPTGDTGAQLVLLGEPQGHFAALDYYARIEKLRGVVAAALEGWKQRCDVLVMEGAGSPVELNLTERDLVNLFPIRHLDGRWLLVADIERGGVFAQLAGTWNLLSPEDRARGLGAIVNRFRGDLRLFADPETHLAPYAPGLRVLGTLPLHRDLQPEEEDGLREDDEDRGSGDSMVWIRLPRVSNLTDCQPWWDDVGVRTRWTSNPAAVAAARVIVLPGTKNTIADMRWLRRTGLDRAILSAHAHGATVFGICGGFQMLGRRLVDPDGVAGDSGEEPGLGLLPSVTTFQLRKTVREVVAECDDETWPAYEIHAGETLFTEPVEPLHRVRDVDSDVARPEGARLGRVLGTYLHGCFESPRFRTRIACSAGLPDHRAHPVPWREHRQSVYRRMADHLEEFVDLDPVRRWVGL
ncbi:hypothetical protein ASA1KI_13450 [Opitutales bacterium ASA1]|uniref:cobyric acid synthase n=1 Tax=Congregicoccus parvus TaxID=3081749 RepID=UPI002B30B61C|nr:hypothetical protein ASA1KI_13450 [Opitutales bacterium ASA1]